MKSKEDSEACGFICFIWVFTSFIFHLMLDLIKVLRAPPAFCYLDFWYFYFILLLLFIILCSHDHFILWVKRILLIMS